jgi:hypothetical protein
MAVKRRIGIRLAMPGKTHDRNQSFGRIRGHGGGNINLIVHQLLEERATLPGLVDAISQRQRRDDRELAQSKWRSAQGRGKAPGGGHANAAGATLRGQSSICRMQSPISRTC